MSQQIFQTLQRDPRTSPLANNGQARITTLDDDNARRELEGELSTFVCDGQYGQAMERILQSYLSQQGQARQNAAWVSGFFGSGKSHLQKMLGHLWANTEVSPGKRARDLVLELPDGVKAHFRELDTLAARSGKPLMAASGAMPSGAKDAVRKTVLAILLKAVGMPEKVPQARFCFWLREKGYLDAVRSAVEAEGGTYQRCCPLKVPALSTHFCSLLLFAFHGPRVDGWRSISVSAWWWLRRPLIAAVADVAPWGGVIRQPLGPQLLPLRSIIVSQAADC